MLFSVFFLCVNCLWASAIGNKKKNLLIEKENSIVSNLWSLDHKRCWISLQDTHLLYHRPTELIGAGAELSLIPGQNLFSVLAVVDRFSAKKLNFSIYLIWFSRKSVPGVNAPSSPYIPAWMWVQWSEIKGLNSLNKVSNLRLLSKTAFYANV